MTTWLTPAKPSKRTNGGRKCLNGPAKAKLLPENRALQSQAQHTEKERALTERLGCHLVKLKRVAVELLGQHVPLLQDGLVVVGVLHDGGRLRVPQHLPHVAFKTAYDRCDLWLTPKPSATAGKAQ